MKRVLVTGATGFVGRHCLAPLVARGYEVHAVSTAGRPPAGDDTPRDVRWHASDLLRAGAAARLLAEVEPTHLLHMAWYAAPGKYWTAVENLGWVRASLELFEEFVRHGGRRAVSAGTCAEYDWTFGFCSETLTPLAPATLYGNCKHALRLVMEAYARLSGVSAAWGRLFFLYGAHEHPDRLVSSVIRRMLRRERVPCSHGRQVRDFLYVEDVADAFVALLESAVEGAVNIASGCPVALREVVGLISQRLDGDDLVDFGALAAPQGDPPFLLADVRRLNEEVGWRPRLSLSEGLAQTIEWWRSHAGVEARGSGD
ncbi:MAG TPA: NAD(P)-dependent oxidoreductase [Pyrinomonadaceae bacterium]|nr:NAD(P)-dependent oxidoreductase [Pyrinomonadaceae bacterium]